MSAALPPVPIERAITRAAVRGSLPELLGFAAEVSQAAGFDEETSQALRLAVEEACVNVIDHGYAGAPPGPITITITGQPSRIVVEVADRAPPFVPAAVPRPDLDAAAEDRPLGGLGWYLIGAVMDEVRHSPRAGGGNRLTMIRYRAGPAERQE